MTSAVKPTGKTHSIPGGLALGAAVSILTTILMSILIAYLINTEKVTWETAGYWIMVMLFAASFFGAKGAYTKIKRQRLVVSVMSGVVYWGVLLCMTALFFGGKYGSVLETAALILAGSGTAGLLSKPEKSSFKKKRRSPYR